MTRPPRPTPLTTRFLGAFGLLALAACSSGSDDPVSQNTPPAFTSGGNVSVSIAENTTLVATAEASDPDGDALEYTISGGPDLSLFTINAETGLIEFALAPNFEDPADANTDNVYEVTVAVSDGRGGADFADYDIAVEDAEDVRYLDVLFPETAVSEDMVYATVDGRDLLLNLVTPVGDTETNRPFYLVATGGAFAFTNRFLSQPFAEAFAERGYVAAVMNYRTLGRAPQDGDEWRFAALDATHDMIAAVRYVRANAEAFGVDPDRIIVSGTSAGAIMAASVATTDPDDPANSALADYLATVGGVYGEVGDHLDQSPTVQGALPISGGVFDLFTIDPNSAPTYAAHNELDTVATCYTIQFTGTEHELSGTCDMIPFFQGVGVPAQSYIVLGDEGHVDFTNEEYAEFLGEAYEFFYEHVVTATDDDS